MENIENIIRISTEMYLLNYLIRKKLLTEQEYYEIKNIKFDFINIIVYNPSRICSNKIED